MSRVPAFFRRLIKRAAGYTITELMIAVTIMLIVGGIIFLAVQAGLTLFAKNLAVNQVHATARKAVDTMAFDVARSIDPPQMVYVAPFPTSGEITALDISHPGGLGNIKCVGTVDASTGTFVGAPGILGDYVVVTVAGDLPGPGGGWNVGDWLVYKGGGADPNLASSYNLVSVAGQKFNGFIINRQLGGTT